jgi:hypothetical protein
MTAQSTLGQLGAGAYNILPLAGNTVQQFLEPVNKTFNAAGTVARDTTLAITRDPQLAENARNLPLLIPIGRLAEVAKVGEAVVAAEKETEIVQRAMSKAELKATEETGLLRGGKVGTIKDPHYVSEAVNSDAKRARQRLALGNTPEVKATLEVPAGKFSPPSEVKPLNKMPGGGTERTATGIVPAKIIKSEPMQ